MAIAFVTGILQDAGFLQKRKKNQFGARPHQLKGNHYSSEDIVAEKVWMDQAHLAERLLGTRNVLFWESVSGHGLLSPGGS